MCVHKQTHVCMYAYVCMFVQICMYVCMHMYVCMYVFMYVCIYVCMSISPSFLQTKTLILILTAVTQSLECTEVLLTTYLFARLFLSNQDMVTHELFHVIGAYHEQQNYKSISKAEIMYYNIVPCT